MAFGCIDGIALAEIRAIAAACLGAHPDLDGSRARVNRLSRVLLWAGAVVGVAFLVIVVAKALA